MPKPESPERRTATEAIMQGAKMEQLDALVVAGGGGDS